VKELRNQSYTEYSANVMLGTLYYKSIGGIQGIQEMAWKFNGEKTVENLYSFMGDSGRSKLSNSDWNCTSGLLLIK